VGYVEKGSGRVDIQRAGLVGRVLENHVALLVLVLAQRDKDDVAVVDPDLFPQLAADETEALDAVEALNFVLIFTLPTIPRQVWRAKQGERSIPWPRVYRSPASSIPAHILGHLP
jgi:hypothetical protein